MHGDHSHGKETRTENRSRLKWTLALVLAYMVAEVLGGLISGSLALLADAGHMLSDAASLGLALFAIWAAQRPPSPEHTFGYYRTEILAALANGAILVAVSIYILLEAYRRLAEPVEVRGALMMGIAIGGLAVNLAGLWLLRGGRESSLNLEGAWLHVLADTLGSIQTIIAGILIWQFGWVWADPVASVLIAFFIIFSSWRLLKESVMVLMERAPSHIDVDRVKDAMQGVPGTCGVHDLHIWTITSGLVSLSAHVTCAEGGSQQRVLKELRRVLREEFGIRHVTIQVEMPSFEECRESEI